MPQIRQDDKDNIRTYPGVMKLGQYPACSDLNPRPILQCGTGMPPNRYATPSQEGKRSVERGKGRRDCDRACARAREREIARKMEEQVLVAYQQEVMRSRSRSRGILRIKKS
jgi:hypothetical protein